MESQFEKPEVRFIMVARDINPGQREVETKLFFGLLARVQGNQLDTAMAEAPAVAGEPCLLEITKRTMVPLTN